METETLDKFYLELSQFTKAKTAREIKMKQLLSEALIELEREQGGYNVSLKHDIRKILMED